MPFGQKQKTLWILVGWFLWVWKKMNRIGMITEVY